MASKYLSDGNKGGGFDFYDFKKLLTEQYGKQNAEFFAAAFRDKAGEFLEQSSRFSTLVDWCDEEIRKAAALVNVFSPADKADDYTQAQAKLWREQLHYVAELVYFRGILLDHRTTHEQRQNIEYTISKKNHNNLHQMRCLAFF